MQSISRVWTYGVEDRRRRVLQCTGVTESCGTSTRLIGLRVAHGNEGRRRAADPRPSDRIIMDDEEGDGALHRELAPARVSLYVYEGLYQSLVELALSISLGVRR